MLFLTMLRNIKIHILIPMRRFANFDTTAFKIILTAIQGRHGVQQRHQSVPILPGSQNPLHRRRVGRDDACDNMQVHGHAAQEGEEVGMREVGCAVLEPGVFYMNRLIFFSSE